MILTKEEVAALTGRTRADAQARVLNGMGIQHRRRPDGSLVVARAHVDAQLGVVAASAKVKSFTLDLSAVG